MSCCVSTEIYREVAAEHSDRSVSMGRYMSMKSIRPITLSLIRNSINAKESDKLSLVVSGA